MYCPYAKNDLTDEELANEEWRDVKGWEGYYEVSNLGRVRTIEREIQRIRNGKGSKFVVQARMKVNTQTGCWDKARGRRRYLMVDLHGDGTECKAYIHQMVLEAFVGPRPDGYQACHNDGDSWNNKISNLRWDTVENNHADKKEHGTYLYGENATNVVLTEDDVRCIKARLADGESYKDIANDYPCTRTNIYRIDKGDSWAHITI